VLLIPPWDCSPYDRASPSCAVIGSRVAALARLAEPASTHGRLVITTVETLLQRLPPRSVWAGARLELAADRPTDDLKVWLISNGYVLDERVDEHGEAAFRNPAQARGGRTAWSGGQRQGRATTAGGPQ
jgi:transcription-repair coupling factor (superfamily II helicase)